MASTLTELRKASGLTDEQLAVHMGVTSATVRNWRAKPQTIRIGYIPKMAELLKSTPDELFRTILAQIQSEPEAKVS